MSDRGSTYEEHTHEAYPVASENIVIGLCLGELSAAAVSLARSLVELLPLAAESVRVALRGGFAANRISREIEQPSSPQRAWSTVIPKTNELAQPNVLNAAQLAIVSH